MINPEIKRNGRRKKAGIFSFAISSIYTKSRVTLSLHKLHYPQNPFFSFPSLHIQTTQSQSIKKYISNNGTSDRLDARLSMSDGFPLTEGLCAEDLIVVGTG